MNQIDKPDRRDLIRLVTWVCLFVIGAFVTVLVGFGFKRGLEDAAGPTGRMALSIVSTFGYAGPFMAGMGSMIIGAMMFLVDTKVSFSRHLSGVLGASLGMTVLLGAIGFEGGSVGDAIGGSLSAGLGRPIGLILGLACLLGPLWAAWGRGLLAQNQKNPQLAPSGRKVSDGMEAGVTLDEVEALAPDPETLERLELLWNAPPTQEGDTPGSPYPDDVRHAGGVPDGAAPLTGAGSTPSVKTEPSTEDQVDAPEQAEDRPLHDAANRWVPSKSATGPDAAGADLAAPLGGASDRDSEAGTAEPAGRELTRDPVADAAAGSEIAAQAAGTGSPEASSGSGLAASLALGAETTASAAVPIAANPALQASELKVEPLPKRATGASNAPPSPSWEQSELFETESKDADEADPDADVAVDEAQPQDAEIEEPASLDSAISPVTQTDEVELAEADAAEESIEEDDSESPISASAEADEATEESDEDDEYEYEYEEEGEAELEEEEEEEEEEEAGDSEVELEAEDSENEESEDEYEYVEAAEHEEADAEDDSDAEETEYEDEAESELAEGSDEEEEVEEEGLEDESEELEDEPDQYKASQTPDLEESAAADDLDSELELTLAEAEVEGVAATEYSGDPLSSDDEKSPETAAVEADEQLDPVPSASAESAAESNSSDERNEPDREADEPQSGASGAEGKASSQSDIVIQPVPAPGTPSGSDKSTPAAPAKIAPATVSASSGGIQLDPEELLYRSGALFLNRGRVAVSLLQREFNIEFDAACTILDQLQQRGLIGPYLGGQRRDILLGREEWDERFAQSRSV
ncbi:MAG: hypothetical protein ACI835_000953 [Planctomycetota bacterium]|jgi:hypothetical protein